VKLYNNILTHIFCHDYFFSYYEEGYVG